MSLLELELDRVAHGGTVVGRADNKVCFVTGGLPGELVRIEVTEHGKRFDRGRVVEVLRPAAGRVEPPCPVAAECGGCDWQYADTQTQLALKTAVVAEQLQRLAGIHWDGQVQAVGQAAKSRTRMRYAVAADGLVGLRAKRSHDVVPLPPQGCLVAADELPAARLNELAAGGSQLQLVSAASGLTALRDNQVVLGQAVVKEQVLGREFAVAANGFWQVHPRAATVLTEAVLASLQPQPGELALDLYCGVGLFAGALVDAGCQVFGVELAAAAVNHARGNVPEARFMAADLDRVLPKLPNGPDLIVLDPPRSGSNAAQVAKLASLGAREICYVSCDPASLARDLGYFAQQGYQLQQLQAFDLFPMTHHVECVAKLTPAGH